MWMKEGKPLNSEAKENTEWWEVSWHPYFFPGERSDFCSDPTQEINFPTKRGQYIFFQHAMWNACTFPYTGEWLRYVMMGLGEPQAPQPLQAASTMWPAPQMALLLWFHVFTLFPVTSERRYSSEVEVWRTVRAVGQTWVELQILPLTSWVTWATSLTSPAFCSSSVG